MNCVKCSRETGRAVCAVCEAKIDEQIVRHIATARAIAELLEATCKKVEESS